MKATPRKNNTNAGDKWTQEEEDVFILLCQQGKSGTEICDILGRTIGSLENRAYRLRDQGRLSLADVTWRNIGRPPLASNHTSLPAQKKPWPEDARFDGPREYHLRRRGFTFIWNGLRFVAVGGPDGI